MDISALQLLVRRVANYKLARHGIVKAARPITLTHSVTAACQSLCLSCKIGDVYLKNPTIRKSDLRLDEIEKIYKSIGKIHFLNISGGEPFMRKELADIVALGYKHLQPKVIHIPTNALAPKHIEKTVATMLEMLQSNGSTIPLTIKPSIDGVGEKHDYLRGVPGNFLKLEDTIRRLLGLREKYANLYVELGTVISKNNIKDIEEVATYVHSLGIESYRNEVAEERTEFHNMGDDITPSAEEYRDAMDTFGRKIRENIKGKRAFTKMTESFRLVYYDLTYQILKRKTQVIPCYGGISNVHLNYNGELWPCCVLGYDQPLGNFREHDYNFDLVMATGQARKVLKYIKDKKCYCPLANQWYSNILINFRTMSRVTGNMVRFLVS